ncbi:MAG: Mov34/MPN/PAD-1 family protein [Candidatus Diapherotrites archaeon]|nr:Mov34/MPN/PAD-1 family protein [Candidatus Diapherotrites archaeon]
MKISATAVEFILETARGAYPREFVGLLRGKDGVIIEVLIFPGSKFEENRSSIFMHMVPLDPSIVGSVHSHPGPARPSRADLQFFERGMVNIIAGRPYTFENLAAFDAHGNPTKLEIVK